MKSTKKSILFSAYSLEIGGIETALISLLNYLEKTNKYEITLVLEKKQGELLDKLNKNVKIIKYTPSYNKIFSKVINGCKRLKFTLKYKNKFDSSFAYATYCKMASATAQIASKNSNLWVHSSYLDIFNNNRNKYKEFFEKLNVNNFKNIIFVSNKSKNEFETIMNRTNTIVCNNIIDYKKIEKLSQEKIELNKTQEFTFLYIGRITEDSKKISRLLEAAKVLKNKNYEFRIIIIGNGTDFEKSQEYVKKNNLQNHIIFLGMKINPYPYYKISDSLILVSENEGYPVVYNEAKILNLPIITTDVSDSRFDIENKFGIVCKQNLEDIIDKMEYVIKNGFTPIIPKFEKFSAEQYNESIAQKIENIINERN